jgi:hypothetical protein
VAYTVRRAQAMPQAVGDLILAQPGRLGSGFAGSHSRSRDSRFGSAFDKNID